MSTDNWIQVLIGVLGIVCLLVGRMIKRLENVLEKHTDLLLDHESRISIVETLRNYINPK